MIYKIGERRLEQRGSGHWIADNATVIGSVIMEANSSIWFNAVLRADNDVIEIGENTNIQDGAVLHVDPGVPMKLGRDVTVGHKVMLHGCTVGDNSLIGINAVVLNKAVIGNNCIIGANSLVPEGMKIPDNSLVMGSPAKVVKEIGEGHKAMLTMGSMHYVAHAKEFAQHLEVDERFHD
ncbi:gamma carbonic anhydrase family protein [Alcanivorax sp. HI0083]|jgi:carbonic anhydrase/acetyltransferase-like protein (isoleucine patch superfamily)|uniref:gamma carbonic anhydrase family protein n=1 Tax=unclassified Alcanivorax TaxID=2638842 RepID=UPI0007B9104A|nr:MULTISPECIES: gamma carbonic anhydrase family protein [unclassified Alcanivorax]KZY28790.1 gamma carbonic anhydrase family protein [Alcanivorax sp. HI0044]KZY38090.1 gamma carbonic anhydrase family protein [Alcanivorax sp. HI0044]KZZ26290.1 gamma carbonic anhydrase family protein [Alcanivorax sp. HI0083]